MEASTLRKRMPVSALFDTNINAFIAAAKGKK